MSDKIIPSPFSKELGSRTQGLKTSQADSQVVISKQNPVQSCSPQQRIHRRRAWANGEPALKRTCHVQVKYDRNKFPSIPFWMTLSALQVLPGILETLVPKFIMQCNQHSIRSGISWEEPEYSCWMENVTPYSHHANCEKCFKHNITCSLPVSFYFSSQKHPNYHAKELGKDGFYVVLSPKHSIVMGLFICVFTVTQCSPVIETTMKRAGMCFPQIKGNFCFQS